MNNLNKLKNEYAISEKLRKERELEFRPDEFHFEMIKYKSAGVKIVDDLKPSKYMILGGYIAPIYYGDTSFYGNSTCLGNAFCGTLVYDLNGEGKDFENVYFLTRKGYPFKGAMINDVLSYLGATFELKGNEFDKYGYLLLERVNFDKFSIENRVKGVKQLLKSMDISDNNQKDIIKDTITNANIVLNAKKAEDKKTAQKDSCK